MQICDVVRADDDDDDDDDDDNEMRVFSGGNVAYLNPTVFA